MSEPHVIGCATCRGIVPSTWIYCSACGSLLRPHKLTVRGDAYRDRLVAARLNLGHVNLTVIPEDPRRD